MILNATTKSIKLKLNADVASFQLPIIVNYTDYGIGNLPIATCFVTNNQNDVVIVPAPGAGVTRLIMFVNIYNRDTASATVTIKYDIAGDDSYVWRKATLTSGAGLIYSRGIWY